MRVKQAHAAPPLDVLDFLLGVSRRPEEIDRLIATGVSYDSFSEFFLDQMSVAEFRELWHQHEAVIVAECRRRNMPVPDPATYRPRAWVKYGG